MKKILIAGVAGLSFLGAVESAQAAPENNAPKIVMTDTASSSAQGVIVPLFLLVLIAAAMSAGSSTEMPLPMPG